MSIGHLLFGFQGRASRLHFWLGQLALVVLIVVIVAMSLFGLASAKGATTPQELLGAIGILFLVFIAFFVLAAWVSWAVAVKRLHDRNKSGKWLLLTLAPTAIVLWTWFTQGLPAVILLDKSPLMLVLQLVIAAWYIIELGFLKGTPGGNMYGPAHGGGGCLASGFDDLFHGDAGLADEAPARRESVHAAPAAVTKTQTVQRMVKQPATGRHSGAFGRRGSHA